MTEKHLLNDLLEKVLNERKGSFVTLSTYVWELKISKKIMDYFVDKYIEDVGVDELYEFFNIVRFKDNGQLLSSKYIKSMRTLLRATYKKALFSDYINYNPFDYDFKLPKARAAIATDRIISDDDLEKLLVACKSNDRFGIIIPILLLTGMRIGELLGLYWSDIDYERNIIYIKRAAVRNYIEKSDGKIVRVDDMIGDTKTRCSVRELPVINQQVIDLLLEWKDHINSYPKLAEKIIENKNENLIFVNYQGRVMNYNTLYKELQDFLKKNNLEHCGILFHKLRHCYATSMVDCGIDINIISKLLGHKNITTTAMTYAKVRLEPKIKAVQVHEQYIHKTLKALK